MNYILDCEYGSRRLVVLYCKKIFKLIGINFGRSLYNKWLYIVIIND